MITDIDNLEQLKFIINSDPRVILVNFFAHWCTPCQLLNPLLLQLEKTYLNKVLIIRVDIDRYPRIADAFSITAMPTICFFFNKVFWKELTVSGGDIGTIYMNVSILLTQHNDGLLPMQSALLYNPKEPLDSYPVN